MWGERLKRILLILGVTGMTLIGAGAVRRWQPPTEVLTDKIEEIGEGILGKAVEVLPVEEKLKKEIVVQENKTDNKTETTKVLETQTKEIIEILKELPEEQLKQIRKQVFKDFCEKVMGD